MTSPILDHVQMEYSYTSPSNPSPATFLLLLDDKQYDTYYQQVSQPWYKEFTSTPEQLF